MRWKELLGVLASAIAVGTVSTAAHAHSVTIDGDGSDWFSRPPPAANLGWLARDSNQAGEFIWNDQSGDARDATGAASAAETEADITGVQVTANNSGLYIIVRTAGNAGGTNPIQVQVAMDTTPGGTQGLLNGARARTRADAAWDYLIFNTRAGNPPIMNAGGAVIGTGEASRSGNVLEFSVPWGVIGGIPNRIRFTIASFRTSTADTVRTLPGNSNVVDVVTNYGDPRTTGYPANGTNAAITDAAGTLDYAFNVWFTPMTAEPRAPFVISRFMPIGMAGGQVNTFVEIINQSGTALQASEYRIGNAQLPDLAVTGQSMYALPALNVNNGGAYILAQRAASFAMAFPMTANAEIENTNAVPNATPHNVWSTGSWTLAAQDEVVVLDGDNNIVDVATYGGSTFGAPGITPIMGTAPVLNQVATRNASNTDTDNCATDFTFLGGCNVDADCGSPCKTCSGRLCVNRPVGTNCGGDMCTGQRTCDNSGTCLNSTGPLTCNDNNECTSDTCNPMTGCVNTPRTGMACGSSNMCTGPGVCMQVGASSMCVAGMPRDCNDNNPCTDDSCDMMRGCVNTPVPNRPCDDRNVCTMDDRCSATGMCQPGPSRNCNDNNDCTNDMCDNVRGCLNTPLVGRTCGGDMCVGLGTCNMMGMCSGASRVVCPPSGSMCFNLVCQGSSGSCVPQTIPGTNCDGGLPDIIVRPDVIVPPDVVVDVPQPDVQMDVRPPPDVVIFPDVPPGGDVIVVNDVPGIFYPDGIVIFPNTDASAGDDIVARDGTIVGPDGDSDGGTITEDGSAGDGNVAMDASADGISGDGSVTPSDATSGSDGRMTGSEPTAPPGGCCGPSTVGNKNDTKSSGQLLALGLVGLAVLSSRRRRRN